jgi:hypothetical protein
MKEKKSLKKRHIKEIMILHTPEYYIQEKKRKKIYTNYEKKKNMI